ncbi:sulfite exporter TauE/SafE family protein [Rickettsiales endosymbiont of Peranema trichophorum]|uniref:sulfite exporter TauE/SafE family protein n=1 Tax=Rickettsiales endosymbiont of Peranema trichophorum TaxID=2486577 RepID=UPI001023472F|nr:sulfite exporter TauE/SafE family protein [Rickettsiales endosymbiont of Peranema trichophorum]RZI46303.1 sulfite exporter TauE/SafE family protein [Rickettsiales endosymbiont of Peranema trichophorum]
MLEVFEVYLPIAGVSINALLLVSVGVAIGVLGGIFGLSGGVFIVSILMAIGISSQVAVAASINQMTAASFSGFIAYAKRKRVDYKLGALMLVGAILGSTIGVWVFDILSEVGVIDTVISVGFILILGTVGYITAKDAAVLLFYKFKNEPPPKQHKKTLLSNIALPYQVHFPSAREEISIFSPLIIGFGGGFVVSVMGIGGSIIIIPSMIYILKISEPFTAGTTHFQIVFTTIIATILHSMTSHNLDIVLSSILMLGTAFGVQIGVRIGAKWHPENYRILLALVLVLLCVQVAYGIVATPRSLYSIEYTANK